MCLGDQIMKSYNQKKKEDLKTLLNYMLDHDKNVRPNIK